MKLGVFAYYNKAFKAFTTNMTYDDHPDEKIVYQVSRELSARMVLGTYRDLKYLALYRLGYFDDETGEFTADKTLLLDLDDQIASFESQLKEKQDGTEKDS